MSGVEVIKNMFDQKPEDMNPREVLKESNAQLRMALLHKMGPKKLSEIAKEIHKNKDGVLLRIMAATVDEENVTLLKVTCPSTGMEFTLRVPPDMTNVSTAREWTFHTDTDTAPVKFTKET